MVRVGRVCVCVLECKHWQGGREGWQSGRWVGFAAFLGSCDVFLVLVLLSFLVWFDSLVTAVALLVNMPGLLHPPPHRTNGLIWSRSKLLPPCMCRTVSCQRGPPERRCPQRHHRRPGHAFEGAPQAGPVAPLQPVPVHQQHPSAGAGWGGGGVRRCFVGVRCSWHDFAGCRINESICSCFDASPK